MDAETLRQAVSQVGFGALWIGLATGFVSKEGVLTSR